MEARERDDGCLWPEFLDGANTARRKGVCLWSERMEDGEKEDNLKGRKQNRRKRKKRREENKKG